MSNAIILFACAILLLTGMIFLSNDQKRREETVRIWLRYAVLEAEKLWGGETGQLKLLEVYKQAVEQFPWLEKTVSFDQFSLWVEGALAWVNERLTQDEFDLFMDE